MTFSNTGLAVSLIFQKGRISSKHKNRQCKDCGICVLPEACWHNVSWDGHRENQNIVLSAVSQTACIDTHCLWHRGSLMQQAICVCVLDRSHSAQSNASLSDVWDHLLSGSHWWVMKKHIPVTKEILNIKMCNTTINHPVKDKFMDIYNQNSRGIILHLH